MYVSPSEGEVEECFYTLTQQDNYPAHEIHIYAEDFNAHDAENSNITSLCKKGFGKSHAKEKHDLLKLQHQVRQKTVTDAMHSPVPNPSHQTTSPQSHSMWDLLRRYKTDHVQSNLSAHSHHFASLDPGARMLKLSSLTFDPQAWLRFRCAPRHQLRTYKASPYNEAAAKKLAIQSAARALLHEVEHPILPVDPLFHEEMKIQEPVTEIKS